MSLGIELFFVVDVVAVVTILNLSWVILHPSVFNLSVNLWVAWVPVGIVVVIFVVNILVVVNMVLLTGVWTVVGI
jgi:hypothetical protein